MDSESEESGPSFTQSSENYEYLFNRVKVSVEEKNIHLKVTSVIVLDEFLKKELISGEFHRLKIKECLRNDKAEEKVELFWSMMIAALIMMYIMMYMIPTGQYYLFKFFFDIYISIILYLGSQFWTKHEY